MVLNVTERNVNVLIALTAVSLTHRLNVSCMVEETVLTLALGTGNSVLLWVDR